MRCKPEQSTAGHHASDVPQAAGEGARKRGPKRPFRRTIVAEATLFGPGLDPDSIRALNTYEATGHMRRRNGETLEDALLERLTTVSLLQRLTPRQQLVVRLMVESYTQREIAETIGMSTRTVVTLVAQLRARLSTADGNRQCIPAAA